MKQAVIANKIHSGANISGQGFFKPKLPRGCLGMMMVFESKKTARLWFDNNIDLIEIKIIKPESK